ncbi:hypothetical protein EU244_028480 [Rhodococcus qingshengii]|uniref:hypothetical protein n=1 Tax=Rhodococcus qingshengii TaxID=334542 RepID=UPI00211EB1BA|nr:hypothetical protein [Rhodococcus qingshengii]
MLHDLLDRATEDINARIRLCLAEAGDNTLARFENVITAVALHYTHRREFAKLHDEFRYLSPSRRAQYVEKRDFTQDELEEILIKGTVVGLFDVADAHFTSRALLGLLGGILDWYSKDGPLSASEIARRYRQCALRLVMAVPPM